MKEKLVKVNWKHVEELRRIRGFMKKEVSAFCGYEESWLSGVELRDSRIPMAALLRLAELLKVDGGELRRRGRRSKPEEMKPEEMKHEEPEQLKLSIEEPTTPKYTNGSAELLEEVKAMHATLKQLLDLWKS